MKKETHYTPKIEEFVNYGFEYEINEDWDVEDQKSWHKQVYSELANDPERLEYVGGNMNKYRVKYLDKDDVESLNFRLIGTHKSRFTGQHIYKFKRVHEFGINTGMIIYITLEEFDTTVKIRTREFGSYETRTREMSFDLKNKAELIYLLKRISTRK